jgi:ABC-2 type transport system permease protein
LKAEFTARDLFQLLRPPVHALLNSRRRAGGGEHAKTMLSALLGLAFCFGIFAGFTRVLNYIARYPEFAAPLTAQILATVSVLVFTMLLASSVVASLSVEYLSHELTLLASSPVPLPALHGARLILTGMQSSWMVLVFSLPIYASFAATAPAPLAFMTGVAVALPPFLVIPVVLGSLTTACLMAFLPVRRVRDGVLVMGAVFAALLVFAIRAQQPERLLNPRSIFDVGEFFASFRTPSSPLLPTTWLAEVLTAARSGKPLPLMPLGLLYTTAGAWVVIRAWLGRVLYWRGYSRAQESRPARFSTLRPVDAALEGLTRPFPGPLRALVLKDVKTFLRDTTQWSQLLLLAGLVVIYLYNFSVLPSNFTFATFFLQNVFAFLNLGLAGFVLSAVGARFVFPSVSAEGSSFWIIRSSPLAVKSFLWSKYWTALPPLLFLSQVLTVVSNHFLGASALMTALSSLTVLLLTFGIVGLGVGLGAAFPRFRFENVTQIAGSFGGLVYMIASSLFVVLVLALEAAPVWLYLSSRFRGQAIGPAELLWGGLALAALMALQFAAVVVPMRWGERRLAALEI